jgi:16S rRNA (adenine1518-N6/adenine1519-N6)-dimethyltransferase
LNHIPRKRFGQNFLRDDHVVHRIVQSVGPSKGERLIEIGPGEGAMTRIFLEAGAHIEAIEIDRDLAALLRNRFANQPGFHLNEGDALKFDFTKLAVEGPVRVVGNLPYNISTPLIFHLLGHAGAISEMTFMLQREVVDRLCAGASDSDYGRLSIMTQYYCEAEKLFEVGPESFYPPPKVVSAIVRLTPHAKPPVDADPKALGRVVTQAFMQRRKTLRNALRDLFSEEDLRGEAIDPTARAETLSLEDYARLARLWASRNP